MAAHGDHPPPYTANPPAPVGFQQQQSSPNVKVTVVEGPGGGGYGGTSCNYVAPPTTVITTQPQVVAASPVVILGSTCPACRAGILQNEFTCCGVCLGIFFFPIGLICCFLMQERRCSNCRISYGG
ncbi:hypothetical protein Pmani_010503 [Petrolisthes manimaculis]|uniref:Membrane protein BRI3 n=1 Tax=Petrolisthes manimaculis TaxID=1843537 RepID=A0AAE1UBW5_9EUCA|nr:hypothetical protein Pmani_010503 [Petrolisthes manimaculis]